MIRHLSIYFSKWWNYTTTAFCAHSQISLTLVVYFCIFKNKIKSTLSTNEGMIKTWKLKFWTDHTWPPASTASTESFVFLPSTVWISEASVISACSHRNTNASKAIYCAGKWGQFLSCYLFVWSGTFQPGLCRTKQNSKSWRKNKWDVTLHDDLRLRR